MTKPNAAAGAANARGEVALPLDGQDYHLRPSYEAIDAIERQTGRTLYELADSARHQGLTLKECGIVGSEMMKAYARTHATSEEPLLGYAGAKPDRVAELVFEAGPALIQPRLALVLLAAVTGGVDASGEMKPAKGSQPPSAG